MSAFYSLPVSVSALQSSLLRSAEVGSILLWMHFFLLQRGRVINRAGLGKASVYVALHTQTVTAVLLRDLYHCQIFGVPHSQEEPEMGIDHK